MGQSPGSPQLRQSLGCVLQLSHQFAHPGKPRPSLSQDPFVLFAAHQEHQPTLAVLVHSFSLGSVQKPSLECPSIKCFFLFVKMGLGFCVYFSCEGPWGASKEGGC